MVNINFCPTCSYSLIKDITDTFYKDGRYVCLQCGKTFRITIDKVDNITQELVIKNLK